MTGEKAVVYVHGRGGRAEDAERFEHIFPGCLVTGFDYSSDTPWDAEREFPPFFESLSDRYGPVILIAESIGAYFSILSLKGCKIGKALLISPVTDMERLILSMLKAAGEDEEDLRRKKEIPTSFGETLSWEYLSYARRHPPGRIAPTEILYGENDAMVPYGDVESYALRADAGITVMKGGEHWFHTDEQLRFEEEWIRKICGT